MLTKYLNNKSYFLSIHDKSGHYLSICDKFKKATGYDDSDIIGKSAYDFFNPKHIPNVLKSHLININLSKIRHSLPIQNKKW